MPKEGDTYTVTLSKTHLEWGNHRYTETRDKVTGEVYIPIPSHVARDFKIYNSKHIKTGLGYNVFNAKTVDGYFEGQLKATGNNKSGEVYAKNLHGNGDLKALGNWFDKVKMKEGDKVKVKWISSTEIRLEKL